MGYLTRILLQMIAYQIIDNFVTWQQGAVNRGMQKDHKMSRRVKLNVAARTSELCAASPTEVAAAAIREAVRQARFVPGQRLVEKDLTEQFGIARANIREALRLLSSEGVVSIVRNKGACVARLSKETLFEVLEMREVLEGLAARRAARWVAKYGVPQDIQVLLEEERNRDVEQSQHIFMETNDQLHRMIAEIAGAAALERVLKTLQMSDTRSLFFRTTSPAIWRNSRAEHVEILEAIIAGQEARAEDAMRAHVRGTATIAAGIPEGLLC